MWKVTIRGLLARKRRFITTTFGVVIGVAYLVGTLIVGGIMRDSIDELVGNSLVGVDVAVRSTLVQETAGGETRGTIEGRVLDEVRKVDALRVAEGVIEQPGISVLDRDNNELGGGFGPPTILYSWVEDDALNNMVMVEGRGPQSPNEVVVDYVTATEGGFKLGDQVGFVTSTGATSATLVGYGGFSKDGKRTGARVVFFTMARAQELARFNGGFSYIVAAAREGVSAEDATARVTAAVSGVDVITGEQFTKERQDQIGQIVTILRSFVQVFAFVALFVTAFVINNTFSIIGAQRARETALLRAIGAGRGQVIRAAIAESALIGIIAGVIGAAVGVGLGGALKSLLTSAFALPEGFPRVTAAHLITGLAVGVLVTVVAAVFPAWRAGRVPPIAALGEMATERSDVARSRQATFALMGAAGIGLIVWGLSLVGEVEPPLNPLFPVGIGAGVCFLAIAVGAPLLVRPLIAVVGPLVAGRGTTGAMARRNATRNPRRTASSAVAVTIGVALVALISVLAASFRNTVSDVFEKSLAVDLVLTTSSRGPESGLPTAVAGDLRRIEGMGQVSGLRFMPATTPTDPDAPVPPGEAPKGQPVFVGAAEVDAIGSLLRIGGVEGDVSRLADGAVAVSKQEAEQQGWKVGDSIPMFFGQVGLRRLEVAAVFDYEGLLGGVLMDIPTFDSVAPPGQILDSFVLARFAEGADRERVRAAVDEVVKPLPTVKVQDVGQLVAEQTQLLDGLLGIVYGLLALAVLIAVTGIASTLSLAVYERTRELGLLRAVGTQRKQVSSMIRRESIIVCLFGALLGLGLGVVFAILIARPLAAEIDGYTTAIPWATMIVILVVAVVLGVVAAITPARRANRLDVLESIASV